MVLLNFRDCFPDKYLPVEDLWANPPAELYSAVKASEIWTLYGEKPLENVSIPALGKIYGDKVTYYVRKGKHFLSRDDWQRFLSVFDKNIDYTIKKARRYFLFIIRM